MWKHRCRQCGSKLIRVQRTPADRLHSLLAPVRRFRCRGVECGLEVTLPKTHSVQRRSMLAFGALVATLAGAVTGGFIYTMSDPPPRSDVLEGDRNRAEYQTGNFNGSMAATPPAQFSLDLEPDSTSHLDPLSLPSPSDTALDACNGKRTADCSTFGVTLHTGRN